MVGFFDRRRLLYVRGWKEKEKQLAEKQRVGALVSRVKTGSKSLLIVVPLPPIANCNALARR